MEFHEGKLDVHTLQHSLLSKLGHPNPGIIVSSLIGIDACAYEFKQGQTIAKKYYDIDEECYTICKSDPITFPTPNPGRYAIIVNLNDLACLGAVPYGVLVTWLLPVTTSLIDIEKKQSELHTTAKEFGITILGGHTEFTTAVSRPIISLSMIGFTPKSFLPPRTLEQGDSIYLLGNIANEGTAILGHELDGKKHIPEDLKNYLSDLPLFEGGLSIFRDGLKINKRYKPKMMHDPTEGGLLGAIYEMMIDQKVGIHIESSKLTIAKLTKSICSYLQIDPLRLISSGTLLICSREEINVDTLNLEHSLVKIGFVTDTKKLFLDESEIQAPEADQLIQGLKKLEELSKQ